jgi:exodeoxyribonuclease VII small subunit
MVRRTFEQSITRLEQIVAELEQGDVDLDLSLKKFDEGVHLSSFCRQKLGEARSRTELLLRKDGGLAVVPFAEESN